MLAIQVATSVVQQEQLAHTNMTMLAMMYAMNVAQREQLATISTKMEAQIVIFATIHLC